jgi:hypothetical protein
MEQWTVFKNENKLHETNSSICAGVHSSGGYLFSMAEIRGFVTINVPL